MEAILDLLLKRTCYVSVVSFMCALNQPLVTDPILLKGASSSYYIKAKNALALCKCVRSHTTCVNKFTMNFSSYFVIRSV